MTGIFRHKSPLNIIFLFVLGVAVRLPSFSIKYIPLSHNNDGFFYHSLINFLKSAGEQFPIFPILAFLLVFTQALHLNRIISDQRMIASPSHLPAAAYLLITALLPEWTMFSAPLIINSLVLFLLSATVKMHNQPDIRSSIFNIGLLLGLSSYIFPPSLILFLWVSIVVMSLRTIRFNEIIIGFLGLLTPLYFYGAWLFYTDQWSWAKLIPPLNFNLPKPISSFWLAGSIFLIIFPFLLGGYQVQDNLRKLLINIRKNWGHILVYLFLAVLLPFLAPSVLLENWVLTAIPFAAFHASFYSYTKKKWFANTVFWITIVFIIAWQYLGAGW